MALAEAQMRNGKLIVPGDIEYGPARPAAEVKADLELAAARRKFEAAKELLMSFEPAADQLDAAARALVKIAHKAINPRKTSADEDA